MRQDRFRNITFSFTAKNTKQVKVIEQKAEIVEKDYSLVPSRYIEFVNRVETVGYEEKMSRLQGELKELLIQEQQSRQDLLEMMKGLGYEIRL